MAHLRRHLKPVANVSLLRQTGLNPELGAALVLDDVINRYLACYNARDIDGMLDCVT